MLYYFLEKINSLSQAKYTYYKSNNRFSRLDNNIAITIYAIKSQPAV